MTFPSYVGRYKVRDEVGRGGFATVVQAWDEELESFVALKILHQLLADDEDVQRRFLDEARLLRRIRSPNVVTVHDMGRLNDGRPYFVMDFADRGTLEPRLETYSRTQEPDSQSVMALVDAVADGLSALHEAGVVHRDIKPGNILFQKSLRGPTELDKSEECAELPPTLVSADERILLGDLGAAKDLVSRGSHATVVAGTPLYQAPEQSDPDADITPAADIYAATAMLWHVLTGRRPPLMAKVHAHLADLPPPWRDVMRQGMAIEPEDRFCDIGRWRTAIYETITQAHVSANGEPMTQVAPSAGPCPYKGLGAYQPEDAQYFFGREALIDELIRRLQLHKVLTVGGPSGSGKSSLVRAGLIPAIRAGALSGSREACRVALLTPGRDPLAELYFQVTGSPSNGTPTVSLEELIDRPTMARHLSWKDGTGHQLVLCIDQFEELFTLVPETQRRKFITAISAMTDPADSEVRLVIAVRADFYGTCAQVPWLAERITSNQVLVGPMTDTELRRAITEPARRAGLYVENNLVDAIIDEAMNEAGSLPLIAHALVETWMRRQGATLTLSGFQEAGGVAGAISQTAEATFERRFDATERAATKRLFLRMVTPGQDARDVRRVLARSDIDQDSQAEVMQRVVGCLTEARLLTVDDSTVQIAHEALLRTWPRLRDWIEESRDDLHMRQRISHAAAEWDDEGRDSDLLYRGTPLLSGLEWADKHPDQLDALARDFLDASVEARAWDEALAAEKARKTRRIRRIAIAALAFFAVGATAASVVAFLEFRIAQRNEQLAELATAEARERFAGALGAVAHGLADSDPLLALFLAAEAVARAKTNAAIPAYDARAAMVAARRVLARGGPFVLGSPIAAGDASALALSPDGSLLATGQRDGKIALIDAGTRGQVGPFLTDHLGGIRDLAFGPHGRWLASASNDGTIRLWGVDGVPSGRSRMLGEIDDVVMRISFHPNGSTLASANGDGTVQLWDVMHATPVGEPLARRTLAFKVVAFTPDGRGVVAGHNDGTINGWALPSRERLIEPIKSAHMRHLSNLVFDAAGSRLATTSTDGTSIVVEYPSGRIVGQAFVGEVQVGSVAFTSDGSMLVGGGTDGTVKLWDVDRHELVTVTQRGHTRAIVDLELSQDGRVLTTLGRDQEIRLWDFGSSYPMSAARHVVGRMAKGLAFSGDGRRLAAGDDTGAVHIWELGSDNDPIILHGHKHQVWALAFSPNGALLATGDRAGQVSLWDSATGSLRWTGSAGEFAIWSIDFTSDGDQFLTASDNEVRLWDVETGDVQRVLQQEDGRITRAVLSPDGLLLAVVSTDGKVRLWNPHEGTIIKEIAADDNVVWSVAFSPDGRHLATASSDEVVVLWDVATGRQLSTFAGHTGGATDVAYLADGVTLVATDRTGYVHLWDARSGRRLTEARQGHSGASWRIAVHPDGERFGTSGDDGLVKVWDELSVNRACEIGLPAFDEIRRRQYLGNTERPVACD